MTDGIGVRVRHQAYLDAYRQDGLAGLDEAARRELALHLVHEARKGAFGLEHETDEALLIAFMAHFQAEFIDDQDVHLVLDYSWGIREQARALAAQGRLVEPIILFATWVEHWLNGALLTRSLKHGLGYDHAQQLLRESTLKAKYTWIWALLELPPLLPDTLARLQRLSDTRNQYVHYKWPAQPAEAVDVPDARLVAIVDDAEPLCRLLVDYELDNISSPALPIAERVFHVELREGLRAQ